MLLLTLSILAFSLCAQEDYQKYRSLSYAEIDSLFVMPYQQGDFDECLLYMQAGREKAREDFGEQDSVFADYTDNLGFFYFQIGRYAKAATLYVEALNIRKALFGQNHPLYATSINNLAVLYDHTGEYEKAKPLYLQVVAIDKATLGQHHPYYALSLINLAGFYRKMGAYEKAEPLFEEALAIQKTALGEDHPDYVQSLSDFAGLYERMGKYEKAEPLFVEALSIQRATLGEDHPNYALFINNLGFLYEQMGKYEKAASLYRKGVNVYKTTFGVHHPRSAILLNNLASVYNNMGQYQLAWEMVTQALSGMSGVDAPTTFDEHWLNELQTAFFTPEEHEHIKEMLHSLAIVYQLLQKDSGIVDVHSKQKGVVDLAMTLLQKARKAATHEGAKLATLEESNHWLKKSLAVLDTAADNRQAFELADQNKSVLLLQATKSEQAYRLGKLPNDLARQNQRLFNKQSELQAKLLEKRSTAEKSKFRNALNQVNQDIDKWLNLVKKEYPKYYDLQYQEIRTKVHEIQAGLADKTALIEYVIADTVLHIFKVDKLGVQWHQEPLMDSVLSANIKHLHTSLSNYKQLVNQEKLNYKKYTRLAFWFYQKLLAPILKEKDALENLIFVTDGELGHLPFEAFLVEAASQKGNYSELHYLLKDYNISYNYSAALWKENKEAPENKNNGQLLAMAANYQLQLDSTKKAVRLLDDQSLRAHLQPLPAARKEVEALQAKYKGFFAFDALASEKTVKAKASDYAILHFATHGILNERQPVLSSLAFSEDNDSQESNFWQAHEISKMKLKADLVVLSACETGYGRFEAGNGIASLARAFMYAGVPALVVSLWQVNDQATSAIMQNFYANLEKGMKKDEALREAKLQYIEAANGITAHPAFWSPFIMIGKRASIPIQKKGNYWPWVIGGGVLLLLMGGLYLMRSRKTETA